MSEPNNLQQYNETFLRELERLNPSQREAVDQIDGPVLVIAGPGTGKTQILAARVGRILLETDTLPQSILCLTFTDAGVHAMRRRLLEFIGPEAHRVHIYTFHSFCNSIIQDNLELFGRHDLEPISDLERVEIIRKIIDELDVAHPLKHGQSDAYFYETHLRDLFQRMKTEAWSTKFVHEKIDDYLADLPNRKEFIYQVTRGDFRKGEPKQAKIDDITERMERLRAATTLYPKFQQAMQRARRYDYDDMILWVLRAFEENEALLRNYQEQYLYFLVDEYQDTNGAQNNILRKLVAYWQSPNMFIVGDDDQSIYEFQGARLKNLINFYETYQDSVQLVLLQDNYRSSQRILDSSQALIHHNQIRVVNSLQGVKKVLNAQNQQFAELEILPKIIAYPNRTHEEADIVQQIEQMYSKGFPLEEVAIIYAKHKQVQNIISLLEKKGIPYQAKRTVNILDLPLIRNLRLFLEFLQTEFKQANAGDHLLYRLWYVDFLNILPADIAKISVHLAKLEMSQRPPLREILRNEAQLTELNLERPASFLQLTQLIDALLTDVASAGLPVLLEKLINRSGLLKMITEHPERVWLLQVIKTFFDFVRSETERRPRLDLRQLLETLQRMDANRLPIGVQKVVIAEHGVNLLTAHSAKGLEFQRVFLLDCVKDNWEPRSRGSSFRFPLPDTLTYAGEEDALEARRRLFYVAMTRAKEILHISYSEQDDAGKELQRAVFVDEIAMGANLVVEQKNVQAADLLEIQFTQLTEQPIAIQPTLEKSVIDELLVGFKMSISALNQYLQCPLSFYFEQVLCVPILPSVSASYGIAMHQALRRMFDRMLLSKTKSFPKEQQLVNFFVEEMEKLRGHFSDLEYERQLETGRRNLAAYYQQYRTSWTKKVRVEMTIRNAEIEGVPITGTIDRLDLSDGLEVTIIDYKTGKAKSQKLRNALKSPPHGGSYWRQLVFYKLLYEIVERSSRRVNAGVISWLEPNNKGNFMDESISFSAKDTAFLRELLRETYAKILQHEFYEGCGEANCQWCDFVQNNVSRDSFAAAEVEELDD